MALACARMQLLNLRKTATSQGCKYDVLRGGMKHSTTCGKAARMAARVASLAWMLAMSQRRIHACSSLPGFITSSNVAGSCSLCVALQLRLFDAASVPPDLLHREEAAGRFVDVRDEVCADSVIVHQPAQLDEQPVRVGLLHSRAVELFQALGGLLETQAHATQELLHLAKAGTDVELLCVEPFAHQAPLIVTALRHRTLVTRRMCSLSRVMSVGDSTVFLPSGAAPPAEGSVRVDPLEHPGPQAPDLTRALRYAPLLFCPPVVQHVEEPVAHEGVKVDFASFCRTPGGLQRVQRPGRLGRHKEC